MAAPIKRVLIVSPHFPPINAPDHQRIRTALPFLEEYGWKAAVLAVHAKYVEGVEDSLLEKTFPATTRIVRTRALSVRLTRLFGVGSVALRALPFLWMAGNKLLRNERTFDLIFFSTTMFPVLILGPIWKRKFGIPYAVDYQDPWINVWPGVEHKGSRAWWSYTLATWLEPWSVRGAALITGMAPGYVAGMLERIFDGAESHDQVARAFVADARSARDVVNRIALERKQVGHLIRLHAHERFGGQRVVPDVVLDRVVHMDVLVDELQHVLVT